MNTKAKCFLQTLILLTLLLSGCVADVFTNANGSGDKVNVQIRTKAFSTSEFDGVQVGKIRFILFLKDPGNSDSPLYAAYSTANGTLNVTANGLFDLTIATGHYDFFTVINETPEMTEQLNLIKSVNQLKTILYDWQSTPTTQQNIPLINLGALDVQPGSTSVKGQVRVALNYGENGFVDSPAWSEPSSLVTIEMVRALSQVSLFMRKGDGVTEEVVITGVKIANLAQKSYLIDRYHSEICSKDLFTGPSTTLLEAGGGTTFNDKEYHSLSSAIVAEKSFTRFNGVDDSEDQSAASESNNATYLFINAMFGGVPTTYKVWLGEDNSDFRLKRNTNYNVYATVTRRGSVGIYAVIEPVVMHNITVNWKPVEGLVVVSDREADAGKYVNVWSDYTVYTALLKVYQGDVFHDVLFKYGSLIAVKNYPNETLAMPFVAPTDVNNTGDVKWYPGGFSPTTIADWTSIPYIADGSSFHSGNTQSLVQAGKGDPCRLVGLTAHQIGVEGKVDNNQWHMATPEEYAILIKAESGEQGNDVGFRTFNELMLPNVKYRDHTGELKSTHDGRGNYWTTDGNQAFNFESQVLASRALSVAEPKNGYTIRCVRNVIPAAQITVLPPRIIYYQGSAVNGDRFQIDTNVSYWKMGLIRSGQGVGSSTDFNEFSFAPLASEIKHAIVGSYSQVPKIYIARRESRVDPRSFGVKFNSIHYNGEEHTFYFSIMQFPYTIVGNLDIIGLDATGRIVRGGGKHTLKINLAPTDVAMPVGAKLKVECFYHEKAHGSSDIVVTTVADKYQYEVEMDISANNTPDVIGLVFHIYMDEYGDGYKLIGNDDYYQSNK